MKQKKHAIKTCETVETMKTQN